MEIKTKFNMGDEIYYPTSKGVGHGSIIGFNVYPTNVIKTQIGEVVHFDLNVVYRTREQDEIKEWYCFATKKELLDYLSNN